MQNADYHKSVSDAYHPFRSVIIFITNTCYAACATCNTQAGPDSKQQLNPALTETIVTNAARHHSPLWLTWTGGEPFEAFESLLAGIRTAAAFQAHNEILTSGYWYHKHPGRLKTLADAGPFRLRISLDPEHQESVPLDLVHALIDDAMTRGIPVGFTLRTVPGMFPTASEMRDILLKTHSGLQHAFPAPSRQFHMIPTIPKTVDSAMPGKKLSGVITGPCRQGFRDRITGPDGRLYPCCGLFGLGIDDQVSVSENASESTDTIRIKYTRPLFQALISKGPYALGVQTGIIPDILPETGYSHQCQVCRMVLQALYQNDAGNISRKHFYDETP